MSTSMFHYCEQRAGKDFTGEVSTAQGWQTRTYRMFARDLELNPQLTLDPVVAYMQARSEWISMSLNYGQVTVCRLADFVLAADRTLAEAPWSLVLDRTENN